MPVTVALCGAAAAFLLRFLEPTLPTLVPDAALAPERREEILAVMAARAMPTLLLVPLIGAVAGLIGWHLGVVLRRQGEPAAGPFEAPATGPGAARDRRWAV